MSDFDFSGVTTAELKKFLQDEEYELGDYATARKAELVAFIEQEGLSEKLDAQFNGSHFAGATLLPDDIQAPEVPSVPTKGTKEWNDYVLGQFFESEKVDYVTQEGRKIEAVRADGLRRVGELILGKVLFSGPIDQNIDYSGPKGLPCAWVKYRIVIQNAFGLVQEYSSLGDVSYLNTENAFLAFALATAETRAKGRAWREALGVKTYALEEFSGKKNTAEAVEEVSSQDWDENKPASSAQMRSIKSRCNLLKIDVYKLLNAKGKLLTYDGMGDRYTGLDDENLTSKSALKIMGFLNDMQQGKMEINSTIRSE